MIGCGRRGHNYTNPWRQERWHCSLLFSIRRLTNERNAENAVKRFFDRQANDVSWCEVCKNAAWFSWGHLLESLGDVIILSSLRHHVQSCTIRWPSAQIPLCDNVWWYRAFTLQSTSQKNPQTFKWTIKGNKRKSHYGPF